MLFTNAQIKMFKQLVEDLQTTVKTANRQKNIFGFRNYSKSINAIRFGIAKSTSDIDAVKKQISSTKMAMIEENRIFQPLDNLLNILKENFTNSKAAYRNYVERLRDAVSILGDFVAEQSKLQLQTPVRSAPAASPNNGDGDAPPETPPVDYIGRDALPPETPPVDYIGRNALPPETYAIDIKSTWINRDQPLSTDDGKRSEAFVRFKGVPTKYDDTIKFYNANKITDSIYAGEGPDFANRQGSPARYIDFLFNQEIAQIVALGIPTETTARYKKDGTEVEVNKGFFDYLTKVPFAVKFNDTVYHVDAKLRADAADDKEAIKVYDLSITNGDTTQTKTVYHFHQLKDMEAFLPNTEQDKRLLGELEQGVADHKATYVHCAAGLGRTGAAVMSLVMANSARSHSEMANLHLTKPQLEIINKIANNQGYDYHGIAFHATPKNGQQLYDLLIADVKQDERMGNIEFEEALQIKADLKKLVNGKDQPESSDFALLELLAKQLNTLRDQRPSLIQRVPQLFASYLTARSMIEKHQAALAQRPHTSDGLILSIEQNAVAIKKSAKTAPGVPPRRRPVRDSQSDTTHQADVVTKQQQGKDKEALTKATDELLSLSSAAPPVPPRKHVPPLVPVRNFLNQRAATSANDHSGIHPGNHNE